MNRNEAFRRLKEVASRHCGTGESIHWFIDYWWRDGLNTLEKNDVSSAAKKEVLEIVFQYYSSNNPYRAACVAETMGKPQELVFQLAEEALEFDLQKNPYIGIYVMDVHASEILERFELDQQRVREIAQRAYEKRLASHDPRDHEIAKKIVKPLLTWSAPWL